MFFAKHTQTKQPFCLLTLFTTLNLPLDIESNKKRTCPDIFLLSKQIWDKVKSVHHLYQPWSESRWVWGPGRVVAQPTSQTGSLPRSTSRTAECNLCTRYFFPLQDISATVRSVTLSSSELRSNVGVTFSPTFTQQHLGGDVVWRSHQRVGQAALVLSVGTLLQCH